jgi:hypothetical protein
MMTVFCRYMYGYGRNCSICFPDNWYIIRREKVGSDEKGLGQRGEHEPDRLSFKAQLRAESPS